MKKISQRLEEIKIKIQKGEEADRKIRAKVKKAIAGIIQKEPGAILEGLYLAWPVLIIKTKNKTAANELFLHKERILESLDGMIKRIVIK